MQFCTHQIHHLTQVFGIVFKIDIIGVDDQQLPFLVVADPVFVAFVEAFEIVEAHIAFIVAASGLDMVNRPPRETYFLQSGSGSNFRISGERDGGRTKF